MKVVTIDFSHETPVVSTHYSGELGEHQAVTLHIIPEDNMQRDEDIAFYYVLFTVEGGLVASRTYEPGEDIDVALWGQLTEQRNFSCQLIGTNGLETIIAKSPVINLSLGKSLDGTVIGIDDNRDSLIAMIGAFNERLTDDEAIISQLQADSQGDLAQTDTEALDYIKNKRVSLLTNDAEYITVNGIKYREMNNGSNTIKVTGAELAYMMLQDKVPVCYKGMPLIAVGNSGRKNMFAFINFNAYGFVFGYIDVYVDGYDVLDGYEKMGGAFRDDDTLLTFYEKADNISFVTNGAVYKYLVDNYYTKTDVNGLISGIGGLNIEIVNSLPSSGETGTLYFVPKTPDTRDVYDEYMWISNAWEHIGSTDVDLSNYYTKSEVNALIPTDTGDLTNNAGFITSSALSGYATEQWVGQQGYITTADIKCVEIRNNTTTTNYTGAQILSMYDNKIPMCYDGMLVIDVLSTDTKATVRFISGTTLMSVGVPLDSTTIQSGIGGYILEPSQYNKLSGGEIVADNSKFVTGGQVYSEGYLKSIPTASTSTLGGVKVDGTSITIADGVISANASLPSGTNEGDILYWHNSAWSVGSIDNVIQNGNNLSY